jgi:hypothetical protein
MYVRSLDIFAIFGPKILEIIQMDDIATSDTINAYDICDFGLIIKFFSLVDEAVN